MFLCLELNSFRRSLREIFISISFVIRLLVDALPFLDQFSVLLVLDVLSLQKSGYILSFLFRML